MATSSAKKAEENYKKSKLPGKPSVLILRQ